MKEYHRLRGSQPGSAATTELAHAAFGMWRDRDDIDDEWLARNRRWYSEWSDENRGEG